MRSQVGVRPHHVDEAKLSVRSVNMENGIEGNMLVLWEIEASAGVC